MTDATAEQLGFRRAIEVLSAYSIDGVESLRTQPTLEMTLAAIRRVAEEMLVADYRRGGFASALESFTNYSLAMATILYRAREQLGDDTLERKLATLNAWATNTELHG